VTGPAPAPPPEDWLAALPDERLAHLVRAAARGFNRGLQIRLAQHDVSFGHWVFLRILWQRDGLTQRDLSQQAGLTEPTAFSALTAMEKLGFVTRDADPHSRRTVRVHLTARGQALRHDLVPLAEAVNRRALRGLPAEDVVVARRVLLAAIRNLAADEAEGAHPPMPSTRELARIIEARDLARGIEAPASGAGRGREPGPEQETRMNRGQRTSRRAAR
jgi:MarR family transcriptional regulator, organic hydroperoxide resistance regulator